MSRYIKATIKRYLPLIIVAVVVTFVSVFVATTLIPHTYSITTNKNTLSVVNGLESASGEIIGALIYLTVPAFILSTIAPIIANDYRNLIKSADLFSQVGCDKKKIRYLNNLLFLIMVVGILFISFFFGFLFILFLQHLAFSKGIVIDENNFRILETRPLPLNMGYIALAFLIIIVLAACNYFVSYFLVTRANCKRNSIFILILGYVALSLGFIVPFQYVTMLPNVDIFYNFLYLPVTRGVTMINMVALLINLISFPIVGQTNPYLTLDESTMNYTIFAIVLTVICVVLFIGIVAFSIYKFITEKESSGEYAGKSSGRSFYQTAIFHSAFTLICFMNIATNNVFMQLVGDVAIAFTTFTFVICASIYFVFLGALRHTFKIDKNNLILFVSSASFNLASIILFYVVKFAML